MNFICVRLFAVGNYYAIDCLHLTSSWRHVQVRVWVLLGCETYRLMHSLFHIKTVIIPIVRYRPEGFSPRVDIGRGMITVLIWKKACINLFITNFNIELKRTKLASHTDTKLMDMSDRYRLRVLLPKRQQIFPRWTSTFSKWLWSDSWAEVTSWGSREAWYCVIRVLPRWQISLWHFRCLRMGKIGVITYKYVINLFYNHVTTS